MTQNSLVTIILPTYNRAHLLPDAINSVLAQTYQNWELLIWNDGSTDDTDRALKTFDDERIECYREENHGKPYALNRCLDLAKGELIAFLDDDDSWLPEKLEIQMAAMEKYPEVDLIIGNFNNINVEDKNQQTGFDQALEGLSQLITQKLDKDFCLVSQGFLKGITRDNFIAFDSVIIRKNVISTIGCFNEKLKNSEDFEYWWRFGLAGLQPAYTEEIILNRIKYPGSLSGRSVVSSLNRLQTLDVCKDLAIKQDRLDLVDLLNPLYRNTWHNLISAYGKQANLSSAFASFKHSLDYGFRLGALRLLLGAFIDKVRG